MKKMILVAVLIIMPNITLCNFISDLSIGITFMQGYQGLKNPIAYKTEFGYKYKGVILFIRGEYWGGFLENDNHEIIIDFTNYCYSVNIIVFLYKGLFLDFGKGNLISIQKNTNYDYYQRQKKITTLGIGYQEPLNEHISVRFEVYQIITMLYDDLNNLNFRIGVNYEF